MHARVLALNRAASLPKHTRGKLFRTCTATNAPFAPFSCSSFTSLHFLTRFLYSTPLLLFAPSQELGTKVEKEALETLRDTYHKTVKQVAVAEKDNRLMIVEIGRLRAELNETRLNAMRHGVNVMGGAAAANVSMLSTSLLLTRSFTGQ